MVSYLKYESVALELLFLLHLDGEVALTNGFHGTMLGDNPDYSGSDDLTHGRSITIGEHDDAGPLATVFRTVHEVTNTIEVGTTATGTVSGREGTTLLPGGVGSLITLGDEV